MNRIVSAIAAAALLNGCASAPNTQPSETLPNSAASSPIVELTMPRAEQSTDRSADNFCTSNSKLAETIMKARQNGLPMAESMRIANTSGNEFPPEFRLAFRAMFQVMVEGAYEEPRYNTPTVQQKAITEFGNTIYRACLKAKGNRVTL